MIEPLNERAMLLGLLAHVPAGTLADALYACGYDASVIVPLLREAGADLSLYSPQMSAHDWVRYQRALVCDREDLASLSDAIRGLQSTDHPSLLPLRDELSEIYRELAARENS